PLDGSAPININTVNQQEVGMKWREGPASANVTLFNARTQESNYEATTQTFTNNKYKSNGIEFEGAYRVGAFRIMGGATYTNAKITASQTAAQVGNKPRRQADWTYTLSPAYSVGAVDFGVALIGTTDSWGDDGNTIKLPGYTVINAFVNYQFNDRLSLSLSANNLFNALGYTEVEGDGHAARAINGRTVRAGVKYTF
ncbi:MAG: TonB-dependent receptor, partial [Betaproteobacteria bacterium]|nr:TonB-dependent receptor [Betaproteobacteria bacterium]